MKKYNLLLALALLTAVLLCAVSCGKNDVLYPFKYPVSEPPASVPPLLFPETSDTVDVSDDPEEPVMNRRFVYEKPGFGGDFDITLRSDGTYYYYEGSLSSNIGMGEWTLEDGILTMTERYYGSGSRVYHFGYSDDALTYIAEDSSKFIYVDVADGDKFDFDKEYQLNDPSSSSVLQEVRLKIFKFKDTEKDPGFGLFIWDNGTFSSSRAYTIAPGSSITSSIAPILYGTWSEEDGIITLSTLSTTFDRPTYRFSYDGSSLVYIDDDADFCRECTLEKGDVLVEE